MNLLRTRRAICLHRLRSSTHSSIIFARGTTYPNSNFHHPSSLSSSAGSHRHYRSILGINGNYAKKITENNTTSGAAKKEDDDRQYDIPPLDLLSVFEEAKRKANEKSAAEKDKASVANDIVRDAAGKDNEYDIPPLDLLSVVEQAKTKSEKGVTSTANENNIVDIPPLDLMGGVLPSKKQQTLDEPIQEDGIDVSPFNLWNMATPSTDEAKTHDNVLNISTKSSGGGSDVLAIVPSSGKGDTAASKRILHDGNNAGSSSPQSRAAQLTREISLLKQKLANKNLPRGHAHRLKSNLKKQQQELALVKLNNSSLHDISSEVAIREKKRLRNRKRTEQRSRAKERSRSLSPNTMYPNNYEQQPIRQTKSYALPRPKASSRGVLIPQFDHEIIQTQANGTILANSGTTSILSTVILVPPDRTASSNAQSFEQTILDSIQRRNAQNGSLFLPLQVEYRERWHASGKIPTHNQRRRDNSGPLTEKEVLASRAIDRTLRPWLTKGLGDTASSGDDVGVLPDDIVVNCQVQSYDTRSSTLDRQRTHADPTALAINSAIATIYQSAYSGNATQFPVPVKAAAAIKLAMRRDGSVIYDPTPDEAEECAFELLYAGTREDVLMFEFSAKGHDNSAEDEIDGCKIDPGIPEDVVADALRLAKEAIVPIIQYQEDLCSKYLNTTMKQDELMSDEELASILGLPGTTESSNTLRLSDENTTLDVVDSVDFTTQGAEQLLDEAHMFVWKKLESAALMSFGFDGQSSNDVSSSLAFIYDGDLPSKKLRGRRETLIQNEVKRLLRDEFKPLQNEGIAAAYCAAVTDPTFLGILTNHTHERVMQQGFGMAASKGFRSDGRPLNAVRPIKAISPIFPDCVHGSASFSRGETQVLSTATISAPRDGMPLINPLSRPSWSDGDSTVSKDDETIPVGSLRFLRSQAEMESDMNTRRVKAGREEIGDSGVLSEVKRSFLHYDFPNFSTGNIKSKAGEAANRRAIGHGNLAERAILPIIPKPDDFPYSIRLTSEVTSSNGSSSMASACGATLSLIDAAVPISAPVVGVSVGLSGAQNLLLDITGTEDHFGNMDCKVCGTFGGITAIQCDVKTPVKARVIIEALNLAKYGRHAILRKMDEACKVTFGGLVPRTTMKSTAPRVEIIAYDPNRKRDLIGPGGVVLRQLQDRFNVTLDLSQEGRCLIFGAVDTVNKAKQVILDLVGDVEVGGVYEGTIIAIKDYGAVVELLRNKEGLLHVSEIADVNEKHAGGNLGLVNEYLKVGDKIEVLCTKIDHVQGSIKLSRKQLLKKAQYLTDHQSDHTESNHFEYQGDNLLHNKQGESNEIPEAEPQSDNNKNSTLNGVDTEHEIESSFAAKYTNVSFNKRDKKFSSAFKYSADGIKQNCSLGLYNLAADCARARDMFYQKLGVSPPKDNFNFASESHYSEARTHESIERGVNVSDEEVQVYIASKVNTAIAKFESARAQSAVPEINRNADDV